MNVTETPNRLHHQRYHIASNSIGLWKRYVVGKAILFITFTLAILVRTEGTKLQ